MVARVMMYSTEICPYCAMAERLLHEKGIQHIEKIRVDLEPLKREEMIAKTNRRTVPQIFIGNTHVGGYDDLLALEKKGELDTLLSD